MNIKGRIIGIKFFIIYLVLFVVKYNKNENFSVYLVNF